MSQTITKSIGEGHGKGELYSALAHNTSDAFGGTEIKSICLNWASYENKDGRVCFYDRNMYVAPWTSTELDIVAPTALWLISDDIYVLGNLHFYGDHGDLISTSTITVTLTDPTTAANAIYGYVDAGGAWTSGNMVGVRGKVAISGSVNFVSATGVWAGLDFATSTGSGSGLTCALNAEVSSNNSVVPNSIIYIQSLPGASANFSDVPYIVFAETRGGSTGTGSRYLFEVGHKAASKIPTIGSNELFYNDTLQIAVNETAGNRTDFFIPLSTVTGTFTTAYPIITTYATIAIDISTCTTGIDITAATTGINLNGAMTTAITIGDGATTGIDITGATNYALDIQTTGHFRMGTDPDTTDIGIPVTNNYPWNMEVYTEPGSALTAGSSGMTCGIRSRYLISVAQTNTISIYAIDARLRVKHAVAGGVHAAIQATIEASTATADWTGSSSTINAAGSFTLDFDELGSLAAGWLCGVSIDSAVHGSLSVASVTFCGLRISTGTSKEPWTYGIHLGDDDAVTGIYIGNATTGILLDGTFTTGLQVTGTLGAADARAIKSNTTINNCDFDDGYGTNEFQLDVTGSSAGHVTTTSIWLNIPSGTQGAGGAWLTPLTVGVYEHGDATIAGSSITFGMHMSLQITDTDAARVCPFSINVAGDTIDAVWNCASPSYLAYAASTNDGESGIVPYLIDSNGRVWFIRLYDS